MREEVEYTTCRPIAEPLALGPPEPSGVFTANAAWLVRAVIGFDFTRVAATLAAPDLARATTAPVRRTLVQVPCRVAKSARRITLHLPRTGLGDPVDPADHPGHRPTHSRYALTTQPSSTALLRKRNAPAERPDAPPRPSTPTSVENRQPVAAGAVGGSGFMRGLGGQLPRPSGKTRRIVKHAATVPGRPRVSSAARGVSEPLWGVVDLSARPESDPPCSYA